MKRARTKKDHSTIERTTRTSAQARTLVLALVCFVLGIGVGACWHFRTTHYHATSAAETGGPLHESTKLVLKALNSPVRIRFYSLLHPATVSDSTRAFAGRVGELLSDYEREGHDKLEVVRTDKLSNASAKAAFADGLRPFNLDKDAASYLGIAIFGNGRSEALAQLSPEWEGAVQFDLTRAIERVSNAGPPSTASIPAGRNAPAVIAEVKRAIPNLDSVSLEQGAEVLREAALRKIAAAASQMEAQVREAQQRLAEARNGKSEAEQQAAINNLQQIQSGQADSIKQIAARLQEQIAALQQLKQQ